MQTSVDHQVNLVYAGSLMLDYWYGDQTFEQNNLKGGDGVWTSAKSNWTDKDAGASGLYDNTSMAMFEGSPGTVTVDNTAGQVIVAAMQFNVDGYTVTGGAISLDGPQGRTRIVTGNQNANSVNVATTLDVVLQDGPSGPQRLVKDDFGTLVLTKVNSYSGGTTIDDGTLQIALDENLGAKDTDITFDGGKREIPAALQNTKAISTNRPVIMKGLGGTFQTDANMILTNKASGAGALTKTGAATLILGADNSYGGGTSIDDGTVQISDDGNLGAKDTGIIFDGGALQNTQVIVTNRPVTMNGLGGTFQTDANMILTNKVSGAGKLTKTGAAALILGADNSYGGGTIVSQGTLQLGNGGDTGDVSGDVTVAKGATLAFNRSDSFSFDNAIKGEGGVHQVGAGTTIFHTAQDYSGPTLINDFVWQFKPNTGLWVDAAYTRDVSGDRRTAFRGDVGVRVKW